RSKAKTKTKTVACPDNISKCSGSAADVPHTIGHVRASSASGVLIDRESLIELLLPNRFRIRFGGGQDHAALGGPVRREVEEGHDDVARRDAGDLTEQLVAAV